MKNEFNFQQRDWFTIQRHELPSSDKLVRIKYFFGFQYNFYT